MQNDQNPTSPDQIEKLPPFAPISDQINPADERENYSQENPFSRRGGPNGQKKKRNNHDPFAKENGFYQVIHH